MYKNIISMTAISMILAGCGYGDAKTAVKSLLNDPESAQFSEVVEGSYSGDVCGKVNARNRMGGYVGATPFFYLKEANYATLVNPPADSDFRALWLRMKINSDFSEKFTEIMSGCKAVDGWSQFCKNSQKISSHEYCSLIGKNPYIFYEKLKERYDGKN